MHTCRSHEEAGRRWNEDRVDGHHVVSQAGSSSVRGKSHITVVVVPVGAIRVRGHEGILLTAVVRGRHGVCCVWRPLVVVHRSNLDKRHRNRIEVCPWRDWLGLVNVRRVLKLVLYLGMRHGVVHGRESEESR